jgi:hypothetical protein
MAKLGQVKVTWHDRNLRAAVRVAANKALRDAAEFILEEANQTVPHEEGTLERSGRVTTDRAKMAAAISYNTPYAVRQHEGYYRHPNGRRRKWLELTLTEQSKKVRDHIARAMKDPFKKGR